MFETLFQFGLIAAASAVLLGRTEVMMGARFAGKHLGKLVGTVQGLRVKFENESKGSTLYEVQSTVRRELQGLRDAQMDIALVGSSRLSTNTANALAARVNSSSYNDVPVAASLSAKSSIANQSELSADNREECVRLARLILADEQLRRSSGEARSSDEENGAEIVSGCITESVLNASHALVTAPPSQNGMRQHP